jgi:GMP synthase (glutamine-hydrolysing)
MLDADPAAPFLLLSIRGEQAAADGEYDAIRRFGGLADQSLRRIRLDREPLGRIDLTQWSGIILGGGPYNVSDPSAGKSADQRRTESALADLIAEVVRRDFPFLGCCYGIGTVGRHLGAAVDRRYAEPISAVPISLSAAGRDDPLFAGLPTEFLAYVGHKEAISRLPAEAVLLASSPACPVQAFRVGRNVYALQFHPELDAPGICTRIEVYKHHGYFEPGTAEELKTQMRRAAVHQPPTILRTFVRRFSAPVGAR